jgi:hypothetical protein
MKWHGSSKATNRAATSDELKEILFLFGPYEINSEENLALVSVLHALFREEPSAVVQLPYVTICQIEDFVEQEEHEITYPTHPIKRWLK